MPPRIDAQDGHEVVGSDRMDDQPSGIAVLRGQQQCMGILFGAEHAPRVVQQRAAEVRELEAAPPPPEQLHAVGLFQALDVCRQGGLLQAECAGGGSHAAGARRGVEGLQRGQEAGAGHGQSIDGVDEDPALFGRKRHRDDTEPAQTAQPCRSHPPLRAPSG